MKETFKRSLNFIRTNPTIISSLLLIVVVLGFLFFNTYLTLSRFEESSDATLRSKAVQAENIIGITAVDYMHSPVEQNAENFSKVIQDVQSKDSEIAQISLWKMQDGNYVQLALAQDPRQQDEKPSDIQKQVALDARKFASSVDDAFAYLSADSSGRYWNVVKAIKADDGQILGLLEMKMSLAQNDSLTKKIIVQAYIFSIAAMLVVLGLILNHIRLFTYEIKAKRLEEIDRMKDDFISMASHELRTPLTVLKGYVEIFTDLLNKDKHNASREEKKYLANMKASVEHLSELAGDLLDVSKIEQNRLSAESIEIDSAEIAKKVAQQLELSAKEKNIELKISLSDLPQAWANEENLKQILINLIGNAIKYTSHGVVEIKGNFDETWVYLTVADTGMGISSEGMKKLFSKFYRIKNSQTAGIHGTGLGLWISRELAQKMGGDISVESIEGVGSHFTLKLKKVI